LIDSKDTDFTLLSYSFANYKNINITALL